jgi:hypothetical protein
VVAGRIALVVVRRTAAVVADRMTAEWASGTASGRMTV